MTTRRYSTGVPLEAHDVLMESVDARAERRANQLAALPIFIGRIIRGRTRESGPVLPPLILPEGLALNLGKRLQAQGDILRDQFTAQLPTLRDKEQYHRYVMGGNKHNRRKETEPSEKEQASLARKRQTQHVNDNLHKNTWIQWQAARLFKASIEHIRQSGAAGREPQEQALRVAASAFEDFGFCLQDQPVLRRVANGYLLPERLICIGQYGAEHPRSLLAQYPVTFLLVQREQERREELWGGNLESYEDAEFGGYRRTLEDEHDEKINDRLIASWQIQ